MIVSDKHRYVYIAIPRTASKSIAQWLAAYYDGHVVGKHHSVDVPHRCRDYLVWTMGRNPYDRAVSGYYAAHNDSTAPAPAEGCSFEQYMTPPMAMGLQSEAIKQAGIQLVLYWEHLPYCLGELPFVGDDYKYPERMTERGTRPATEFEDFFGREAEQFVWDWAEADFEALDYRRLDNGPPLCRWIEKP